MSLCRVIRERIKDYRSSSVNLLVVSRCCLLMLISFTAWYIARCVLEMACLGVEPILDSKGAALTFFSQTDGLDIRWFSEANTEDKLSQALAGDYMMLQCDVALGRGENDTLIPVVGDSQSSLSLEVWIYRLKAKEKIGFKLSFSLLESVEPSLDVIRRSGVGSRPVWLEANVVQASGQKPLVDADKFIDLAQKYYPSAVLSFGWTTTCCQGQYTQALVEEMYSLVKKANYHMTFLIRTSWLTQSLPAIHWLLQQSSRLSLTLWSPVASVSWENVNIYEMVKLRNDHGLDRIYYQLQGKMLDSFTRMAVTMGSPLNVFKMPARDAIDITWGHAVNDRESHKLALQGRLDFLEADILLNAEGVPIMAHPPDTTSDLTFSDFVDGTLLTNKGMKLDFKATDAINPALRYLQSKSSVLHQPVWVNADVLRGPGGKPPTVDGGVLLRYVRNRFPQCTLSLGWTLGTSDKDTPPLVFTSEHVEEMLQFLTPVQQPVTFPVRADLVRANWAQLQRLLDQDRSYTLTLWSRDEVSLDDLLWIRQNIEKSRVYYDLPKLTMQQFRSRI